jgi:superfamily II DNA or RNA helicase
MNVNEKRKARQTVGAEKYIDNNCCGVLHYVTGLGKTYTTILIIYKMLDRLLLSPTSTIYVLVPSDELRNQWRDVILKCTRLTSNTIFINTPNQILLDNTIKECDLLIVDELHKFYSDQFVTTINGKLIKSKYRLGLTATYYDKDERYTRIQSLYPIVDEIGVKEALLNGFISRFTEFNLGLDLSETERTKYDNYSGIIDKELPKFNTGSGYKQALNNAQYCLSGRFLAGKKLKAYDCAAEIARIHGWSKSLDLSNPVHRQINSLWNPGKIIGHAKILMDAIKCRRDLVCESDIKVNTVLEIVKRFNNRKTICFSESTKFANDVSLLLNETFGNNYSVVYHSALLSKPMKDENGEWIKYKTGNKQGEIKLFSNRTLKNLAISKIKSGQARFISTGKALDQGFDVTDIQIGITASGTSNPTQHKQRSGRVVRLDDSYTGNVLIINLYFKNTVDERWLNERQKSSETPIYWIDDVSQINYEPVKTGLMI